jgi:hypothetical protein
MISQLDGAGTGIYVDKSNLDIHIQSLPDVEMSAQAKHPHVESSERSTQRDDAWRHERVAMAAYYLAAHRGFEPGHEAEDWSLAELQTDATDAGRKL